MAIVFMTVAESLGNSVFLLGLSSSEAWQLQSPVLSWRLQGLFDTPAGTPTLFQRGFFWPFSGAICA
jgi:hypothetical protein